MLKEIAAHKWREVIRQKKEYPLEEIIKQLPLISPARNFKEAVQKRFPQLSIIAEIKKASPSCGVIESHFAQVKSPAEIALLYQEAGAAAISVLTEAKYFAGCPADLKSAKSAVSIPVLRKDFIVDEYQIYESRAMGADAVLLIASLLAFTELKRFLQLLHELGMAAIVEVGKKEEILRAVQAGAEIIGINNRNLHTMEIDLRRTLEWGPYVPRDRVLISESGIHCREQVKQLKELGVNAILVGNSLMSSSDPVAKIKELLGEDVSCTR
ncbi:MAG: indole-3-glycerol phosphate synthase TrpC [Dethiobacter sp.]|jgi:indole-3-glycerol phosphate synthase|nr:MAG: indole-3-glycerol phosphate synthase TrpC [Dethiobacter sp.]